MVFLMSVPMTQEPPRWRNQYNSYTPEERRQMTELYKSGLTLKEVAARVGCSSPTVRNSLSEFGLALRPKSGGQKKYSPQDHQRIIDLYRSGLTLKEVSARVGCSPTTVRKSLCEFGVVQRPKSNGRRKYSPYVSRSSTRNCSTSVFLIWAGVRHPSSKANRRDP